MHLCRSFTLYSYRFTLLRIIGTFRVARLTLQAPKLWLVGVATDRDARHACLRFFSFLFFLCVFFLLALLFMLFFLSSQDGSKNEFYKKCCKKSLQQLM